MPLGLKPCLIIHRRRLHVMKVKVHFKNSIIKVSYSNVIGLDDFVFQVSDDVLIIHSLMPHPHKFPNPKPTICLILLTMLISSRSKFIEGVLRGIIYVPMKEPFKEDIFVSDEGIILMLFDIEQLGKLLSSLLKKNLTNWSLLRPVVTCNR
jgi:hypothetical protein